MKRLALIVVALAALAAPSTAVAGGMTAFTLQGPSPDIKAGQAWTAQIRVVGCLGTPADMAQAPSLTATEQASGRSFTVAAKQAGAPGRYTARVVFPAAGDWTYRVILAGWPGEKRGPFTVAAKPRPAKRLIAALPPVGAVLLVLGTGLALRRRRS